VFTYQCGQLGWSGDATIGYNDYANDFYNHPLSGGVDARSIACINQPTSLWSNVVLNITAATVFTPPPPTFSGMDELLWLASFPGPTLVCEL
jgi:hypothetical protein